MIKQFKLGAATLALLGFLSGCASIPTEYTSPCVCLYEPLNTAPSDLADGAEAVV